MQGGNVLFLDLNALAGMCAGGEKFIFIFTRCALFNVNIVLNKKFLTVRNL